jgi:hypothetical protein
LRHREEVKYVRQLLLFSNLLRICYRWQIMFVPCLCLALHRRGRPFATTRWRVLPLNRRYRCLRSLQRSAFLRETLHRRGGIVLWACASGPSRGVAFVFELAAGKSLPHF